MNSENEISPMSQAASNSNISSLNVNSSSPMNPSSQNSEDDFLTAPLKGLMPKPMQEMTEEELRQFAQEIRQMRQSYQTYKAEIEKHEEARGTTVTKPAKVSLKEFDELF